MTIIRRVAVAVTAGALIFGSIAGPAAGHALKGAPKADRQIHAREHLQIAKARQAARVKIARLKVAKVKPARLKTAKARITKQKAVRIKAAKVRAAKARAAAAKARKAARFVATGTVTAVDVNASTVTFDVTGGYRDLHGTSVTVNTATAQITRDDVAATLADIAVGDALMAMGARDGMVASRISATSPPVVDDGLGDEQLSGDTGTGDELTQP